MHRSRRATRIEDRSGIDIVVESDVGELGPLRAERQKVIEAVRARSGRRGRG
jgi:hypothetical protein